MQSRVGSATKKNIHKLNAGPGYTKIPAGLEKQRS
jgi:hypothetical protein